MKMKKTKSKFRAKLPITDDNLGTNHAYGYGFGSSFGSGDSRGRPDYGWGSSPGCGDTRGRGCGFGKGSSSGSGDSIGHGNAFGDGLITHFGKYTYTHKGYGHGLTRGAGDAHCCGSGRGLYEEGSEDVIRSPFIIDNSNGIFLLRYKGNYEEEEN